MKNLFLLLLLPVFACGQSNEVNIAKVDTEKNIITEGFIVTGNVQGVSDGEVKITSLRNDQTLASGNVKGGALEIGRASTRAVVVSCIMILIFDYVLSALLL